MAPVKRGVVMSELNRKLLKRLASLCRIHCTEDDEERLLNDLGKILDYVELLHEVDTDGVDPCNHVISDMVNCMRADVPGDVTPRDVFMRNAPDKVGGMVRVPSVIKKSS